jgi:membrane protein DedA with SNARE-associated domain
VRRDRRGTGEHETDSEADRGAGLAHPAGSMEALIARYGLLAVFAGTFLEGETVLILAGFAAHRGYLELPGVMLAAFLGAFFGDQLWFSIGRRGGRGFLARRPALARRVEGVRPWIARHERTVIWSFRFVYGIRSVAPFALGMSGTSPLRFALLNAASGAVWAVLVSGAGYLLGAGLERILGNLREVEGLVFGAILAAGGVAWSARTWRLRRPIATDGWPGS